MLLWRHICHWCVTGAEDVPRVPQWEQAGRGEAEEHGAAEDQDGAAGGQGLAVTQVPLCGETNWEGNTSHSHKCFRLRRQTFKD